MTTTPHDSSTVPDYPALLRLDDQTHLILGAGQGIGRQAAHAYSQAGSHVVCVDNDADRAARVAAEVGGTAVVADVRREREIVRALHTARDIHGRLNGVVDIVGMARFAEITTATEEHWSSQYEIVLDHARWLLKHGAAMVAQTGGTFAFVSSVAGMTGAQGNGIYASAKAALQSVVRTASVELAGDGVRVNCVAPGVILTPRMADMMTPERRQQFVSAIPLRRLGEAHEVAVALLFLSSPLASYITGQTIVLDGGVQARFPYPNFQ